MDKNKNLSGSLDSENAKTIVDLIADPDTPESLRIKLIRKILETRHSDNFFKTMYEQKLSYGKCPNCRHENHWLIPEAELNRLGWVSSEQDSKVPKFANAEICPKWEQACSKRKCSV